MRYKILLGLMIICSVAVIGCTSGIHGSYAEKTFVDTKDITKYKRLGDAEGRSCQIKVLYFLPVSMPHATTQAIHNAKAQYSNTVFLVDITIDNNSRWDILYLEECIIARGIAYGADNAEK